MRAGPAIDAEPFTAIRRTMALDHFKWDAQVGDVSALAPFPLVLAKEEWAWLAGQAEALTREMFGAEERVVRDPEACDRLGLPRRIRRLLERDDRTASLGRIVRFDFHPTADGWRVSEANSDVPGGFTEASSFTQLVGEATALTPCGDPAGTWMDAIARRVKEIALLVAPGWLEDAQVVAYLARGLRERGVRAEIVTPEGLQWNVEAILRFHQIEWLADLPARTSWKRFFAGGNCLVTNPGIAIVSESKRFPIGCRVAGVAMPAWASLVPETCDVRDADGDGWIFKRTFSNTGEAVYDRRALHMRWFPDRWVAQRRFESRPVDTPDGPRHACVGVYTIDGIAAGAYARLSPRPKIDCYATDAAVLLEAS